MCHDVLRNPEVRVHAGLETRARGEPGGFADQRDRFQPAMDDEQVPGRRTVAAADVALEKDFLLEYVVPPLSVVQSIGIAEPSVTQRLQLALQVQRQRIADAA